MDTIQTGNGVQDSQGRESRLRLLIGPFLGAGTSDYMVGAFDDFDTRTFGSWQGADIQVSGVPDLHQIFDLLPPGWEPDLIILWRPEYHYIPIGLEDSPYPVAMLVSDWYLAFSDCLEAAWRVDVVVTGTRGRRVFNAAGFDHVISMPMLGYQPDLDGRFNLPDHQRDIDVFCGGNANLVIHQKREQILAELLALPEDVHLVHGPYVARQEFCKLLGRSKIFINQTVIAEINMKVYEVTAAGVCLFVEEDNLDIQDYLVPDDSVVLFNRNNLLEKIQYYLENDRERLKIARQGQEAMSKLTYRENFRKIIERLCDMQGIWTKSRKRPVVELSPSDRLEGIVGYTLRHSGGDPSAALSLCKKENLGSSVRPMILMASAQYCASAGSNVQPDLVNDVNCPAAAWSGEKILSLFRDAHIADPKYLPAAYLWAHLAAMHLEASVAFPAFDHVKMLLESGCSVPFSCADYIPLEKNVRFVFERVAWEALEREKSIDDALRPVLYEDVLVNDSKLSISVGDIHRARSALSRAIMIRPQGFLARPRLASLLTQVGELAEAEDVWHSHLDIHPLDMTGHEGLAALAVQNTPTMISGGDDLQLERIKSVFGVS